MSCFVFSFFFILPCMLLSSSFALLFVSKSINKKWINYIFMLHNFWCADILTFVYMRIILICSIRFVVLIWHHVYSYSNKLYQFELYKKWLIQLHPNK
jgi:hypothetical protein